MSEPTADEYAANVAARKERERRVPHVSPDCDDNACWCPNDVLWARLLGDDDPCAPGRDWVAAAFGTIDGGDEWSLPLHRTEAGYPSCGICDGGGCYDCTDPA